MGSIRGGDSSEELLPEGRNKPVDEFTSFKVRFRLKSKGDQAGRNLDAPEMDEVSEILIECHDDSSGFRRPFRDLDIGCPLSRYQAGSDLMSLFS